MSASNEEPFMSTVPARLLTEAEYLARERKADFRSEFYRGEMFAMAGATREHNLITGNCFGVLWQQLGKRGCEVYQSDMKVRIAATGLFTYPDVVVACGQLQFADDQRDVLLNPTVIIEVLSESTAAYDCGPKASHYRRLESLQEFVLLDQNSPYAEHYVREDARSWRITPVENLEAVIRLASIDCQLALAEAYAKVQFRPDAKPLLRPIRT
jgi:Uma2 family endonuclease